MPFTCKGVTKKNRPCRNKVPLEGGCCHVHADINTQTCSICLENLSKDTMVVLKCHHSFHKECIHKWLGKKLECPYCRRPVRDRKTLKWLDAFGDKDEEWLPTNRSAENVPRRRRRRLRAAAQRAQRERETRSAFNLLYDRLMEILS